MKYINIVENENLEITATPEGIEMLKNINKNHIFDVIGMLFYNSEGKDKYTVCGTDNLGYNNQLIIADSKPDVEDDDMFPYNTDFQVGTSFHEGILDACTLNELMAGKTVVLKFSKQMKEEHYI